MAVAAWLVTAVATGYGVAGADTTGASSDSSSTSSASSNTTSSEPAGTSTAGSSTSSTSTTTGSGTTATGETKPSGATSSSAEVAPGVTVSSSGGAHTSTTEPSSSTSTSGVEPPPQSSEPTVPVGVPEPTASSTPPATSAPEPEQPTSTPAKNESNSTHSATVTAATNTLPSPGVVAAATAAQPSAKDTESSAAPTAQALKVNTVSSEVATQTVAEAAAAVAPVGPAAQVAAPAIGVVGFLNGIVTNLLNPFLAPAPNTPEPVTPAIWAVLAWVRRNFFNQAPTIAYNPTTTLQTGQTVTGNLGATDAEGDALTYTVTQGPQHGSLTIDQATGNFTYIPDDINYTAAQTDSFTVSASDGKANLLSLFGMPHSDQASIGLTVLNPTAERVIVNLPAGFTNAAIPRFSADGQSLLFSATPPGAAAGARREIYHVNVDGTGLTCVTCGVVDPTPLRAGTTAPRNLFKPVPFEDGSGRILFQSVDPGNGAYTHVVYESDANGTRLVRVLTPPGKPGVIATDVQREMRISPDGTHVLFSQIQLVPNPSDPPGFITAVPIVGTLTAGVDGSGNKVYNITDARVVFPVGEDKQWTHDGKGVIILGGLYESGNVDDVVVDIATGQVTRLTGNLDYDEDVDLSPNNQWLAIDSTRGLDALTPVTRIVRPAFLPLLIQGSVYTVYAGSSNATNVSNQPWLVAVDDDLNGENGIPLFVSDDPNTPADEGDNWTARSMPSWNADGTAVAFWEADSTDPTGQRSRLVVAKLKYTTSVGAAADKSTPALSSSFPTLATNTPKQVQLLPTGTYTGAGGGTALVAETTNVTTGHVIRTVQYTDYVNGEGMILNGTESTDQSAAQNTIHYVADITVTGTHTGSLTGDATINKLTRTITPTTAGSQIQSTLDGDTLVLLDPARVAADLADV